MNAEFQGRAPHPGPAKHRDGAAEWRAQNADARGIWFAHVNSRATRFVPLRGGFALIELLVVIAIIALLAALLVPSLSMRFCLAG